ncbi:MAG: c-type cytochrome [Chloroflexi bacterium]|nr:c-type cytochrome [Chloroflexota bacterium]MCI0580698.1 c-type cytochrome [Chloroflexota bacterium]MCI0648571.1 c-type cytochrome [Chloroflexota bacterium]MCI0727334.1 c-type cytochrome [Chloroflexota bacterium]
MLKKVGRILSVLACLGTFLALIANLPVFFLPWILWFLAAAALMVWLWPAGRTGAFVLIILGAFVYIGALVTEISGGGGTAVAAEGVNPEAGEAIYWGKGKCSTCHSLGDQGSAIRGPNHENVCAKALAERLPARQAAGASHIQTPTDYLVESIADPQAYIVEGFSGAMPKVYLPPVSLNPDEIRAVIVYMQTQGCEADPAAINLPAEILNAATAEVAAGGEFNLVLVGDPAAGRELFFDEAEAAACVKCHTVAGEGEEVGPELTDVAGTQTAAYIFESIMNPSAEIAAGDYEPIQVRLNDGTVLSGIIVAEDEASLTIKDKEGEETVVNRADVDREARYPDVPSIMPSNFGELLTVQQVADLIAFLQESAGVLPAEEEGE